MAPSSTPRHRPSPRPSTGPLPRGGVGDDGRSDVGLDDQKKAMADWWFFVLMGFESDPFLLLFRDVSYPEVDFKKEKHLCFVKLLLSSGSCSLKKTTPEQPSLLGALLLRSTSRS